MILGEGSDENCSNENKWLDHDDGKRFRCAGGKKDSERNPGCHTGICQDSSILQYYKDQEEKEDHRPIKTILISKGTMYSTVYGYQNVFLGTSPQHPINMLGCSTIIP